MDIKYGKRIKIYAATAAITLILCILALAALPAFVQAVLPQVRLITPLQSEFADYIYMNGTMQAKRQREIIPDLPLVPSTVLVSLGDTVQLGDTLAEVDQAATQAVLIGYLKQLDNIPEQYVSAFAALQTNFTKLLDYIPSKIIAPLSGTVTALDLTEGFASTPQKAVAVISQNEQLLAKMTVGETYANQIKEKDTVVLKASATKNIKYSGTVQTVAPAAHGEIVGTAQQTVVEVMVSIPQSGDLKPGYSVYGVIEPQSKETMLTIPYEAINQEGEQQYVYVYGQGKAVRRNITTGREFADKTQVLSGVSAVDKVVLSDVQLVGKSCYVAVRREEK